MLAYQASAQIDHILSGYTFTPFTKQTMTDALRRHFAQIRRQGYAQDDEEFEVGLCCIAAPICDVSHEVFAGVSISGPTPRMTSEQVALLIPLLLERAEQMSRALGYPGARAVNNGACSASEVEATKVV
jgi:DNA-binding IclR family transcriptional regulator